MCVIERERERKKNKEDDDDDDDWENILRCSCCFGYFNIEHVFEHAHNSLKHTASYIDSFLYIKDVQKKKKFYTFSKIFVVNGPKQHGYIWKRNDLI